MAKIPTMDEMARDIAQKALDDFLYNGKSLREWMKIIASEDCISRKAAQAKIKSICDEYGLSYEDGERKVSTGGSAYALGHAFDDLPSTQKIGNWIKFKEFENGYYHIKCSECGQYWSVDGHAKVFKYCFNCGAKMEVE